MENNNKVVTLANVQWKVKPTIAYQESEPFKIGIWNWVLSVEQVNSEYDKFLSFGLFPVLSSKVKPLYAQFTFGVSISGSSQPTVNHNGLLPKRGFSTRYPLCKGEYVVNVSFSELKSNGGEHISVFPPESKWSSIMTKEDCQNTLPPTMMLVGAGLGGCFLFMAATTTVYFFTMLKTV